jgi:hypothetical protein
LNPLQFAAACGIQIDSPTSTLTTRAELP